MPLVVGIVGKELSGKTTLFEILRAAPRGEESTSGPGGTTIRTVEVPDERLDRLVEVHRPKRRTAVSIQYVDFPGGGGKGETRIASMRQVDAFVLAVRGFKMGDEDPPSPEAAVREVFEEWALYDLEVVGNRLKRLEKALRVQGSGDSPEKREQSHLLRIRESLEKGEGVRSMSLTPEEEKMTRGFRFLTQKPFRVVINAEEEGSLPPTTLDPPPVPIRGQVEREIAELPEGERAPFQEEMGISDPGWNTIPRECLRVLDVVTFYTVVGEEVRAWTLPRGGTAHDAAGRIHADMAKGFVRAEVLPFEEFPEKRKGRLEGRDYVVQDGDILTIRFTK